MRSRRGQFSEGNEDESTESSFEIQKIKDPQITQITQIFFLVGLGGRLTKDAVKCKGVFISPTPSNPESNLRNLCNLWIFNVWDLNRAFVLVYWFHCSSRRARIKREAFRAVWAASKRFRRSVGPLRASAIASAMALRTSEISSADGFSGLEMCSSL